MEYMPLVHIFAILFATIGVFFVVIISLKWNAINIEVLKARVFLNKMFLKKNLIYITLATISLVPYQIVELFEHAGFISAHHIIYEISEMLELVSLIFLVALLYEWYKILSNENFY